MQDDHEGRWLIDTFLQYQEALDKRRKIYGERRPLKDALDSDQARSRLEASKTKFIEAE